MTTQIVERRKKTILYLQIQTYINQNKFILYFIHAKMKQNKRTSTTRFSQWPNKALNGKLNCN